MTLAATTRGQKGKLCTEASGATCASGSSICGLSLEIRGQAMKTTVERLLGHDFYLIAKKQEEKTNENDNQKTYT